MLPALLLVLLLIIYVCLYPFQFHALPRDAWSVFWHSWPRLDRFAFRDGFVNVLLYLPFGTFAYLTLDRIRNVRLRLALTVVLAFFFSTGIELIQLMDSVRSSSTFDVVCNTAGAALGAAVGRVYARHVSGMVKSTAAGLAAAPSAVLLFCLWFVYQSFPLFPSLGVYTVRLQLSLLLAHLSFSPLEALYNAIEWLAAGAVLQKIVRPDKSRAWIFVLLLLLPVRLLLSHHALALNELAGAVAACCVWSAWLNQMPRRAWILSWLLIAGLVLHGLSPYHLSYPPKPFSWIPFAAFIETGNDWGAVMFFRKSFWYGGAVWAFYQAGYGFLRPAIGVAFLLGLLEYVQRYLPGRLPEISDPLLALLLALLFWVLERRLAGRIRRPPAL